MSLLFKNEGECIVWKWTGYLWLQAFIFPLYTHTYVASVKGYYKVLREERS